MPAFVYINQNSLLGNLRIIIYPYNKNLTIELEDTMCEKILRSANRCKSKFGHEEINIPNVGFRGIELTYGETTKLFFYRYGILKSEKNILTLIVDRNWTLFEKVSNKALEKFYRELKYFLRQNKNSKQLEPNLNLKDNKPVDYNNCFLPKNKKWRIK